MSQAQCIAAKKRMRVQRLGTQMLALLKAYVAEDPCAPNEWIFAKAKELIEKAEAGQ